MSTGTSKTRTQRLASIANVPTRLHLAMARLRQKSSIFCCLIFLTAFTALVLLLGIWNPPFPYYEGMAINRDIVARVAFETIDNAETEKERILAANRVPYVYVRSENEEILDENISKIYRILKEASQAEAFDKLSPELQQQFMVPEDSEDSGVETGTRNIWRFLRKNPEQDTPVSQNTEQKAAPASSSTSSPASSASLPAVPSETSETASSEEAWNSAASGAPVASSQTVTSPQTATASQPASLPQPFLPSADTKSTEEGADGQISQERPEQRPGETSESASVPESGAGNADSLSESSSENGDGKDERSSSGNVDASEPSANAASQKESAPGDVSSKPMEAGEAEEASSSAPSVEQGAQETGQGAGQTTDQTAGPNADQTTDQSAGQRTEQISGQETGQTAGQGAGQNVGQNVSQNAGQGENQTVKPPKELEKALVSERSRGKGAESEKSGKKSKSATRDGSKSDLKNASEPQSPSDSESVPAEKSEKASKRKSAAEIVVERTPVLVENSARKAFDGSRKIRYSAKPTTDEDSGATLAPKLIPDSSTGGPESDSSVESVDSESAKPLTETTERGENDSATSKSSDAQNSNEKKIDAQNSSARPFGEKNEPALENSAVMLEKSLTDFCDVLKETIRPFFLKGLMHIAEVKEDPLGRGLQVQIAILNPQNPEMEEERVSLKSVILEDNSAMRDAIRSVAGDSGIGDQIYYCICRNWKSNLLLDPTLTNQAIQNARQSVESVQKQYQISQRIVQAPVENDALVGTYLTADMVKLLSIENERWLENRTWEQKLTRGVAVALILLLCLIPLWAYIAMEEPRIFHEYRRLIFILGFSILALFIAVRCARIHGLPHSMNLFPLILYGQILTIQYQRRIGILFGGMLLLCLYVTLGMTQMEMVCDFGILLTAILPLDRVRGRMQFVQISLLATFFAFVLFSAADLLMGIPFQLDMFNKVFLNCLPFLLAGLVIQSILPLLERWLGILSDARLLELCDVSHPLLNQLVNRAPSTYSHSIALGTLGESAADAIHANGLLVRTAAYYHDIGKIYKPNYYAENIIEKAASPHLSLKPTASALIIIAHVKNGVEYARQNHLPQQIIDLIEQHHGSTLVAYFFNQAKNQRALNPSIPDVEESSFRYPCPKPQTKEAVVLMLADACESACRSLVEPTPARIQGLVRKLAQERLEDEQFDESGITLCELRIVEDCIIKGLISYHHGRIKYPERIREEKPARKTAPDPAP